MLCRKEPTNVDVPSYSVITVSYLLDASDLCLFVVDIHSTYLHVDDYIDTSAISNL